MSTGQSAMDFIKKQTPDDVLMDINMPGMDGFEATGGLETHPVTIIICTATMNMRDLAAAFRVLEAGAVACLEKPASREVLVNLPGNAVKYTGTRGIAEISVGSRETAEELVVFVRDNGAWFRRALC